MMTICYEICCNSEKQQVNIWDVHMVFRDDGDIVSYDDGKTKSILDRSKKA